MRQKKIIKQNSLSWNIAFLPAITPFESIIKKTIILIKNQDWIKLWVSKSQNHKLDQLWSIINQSKVPNPFLKRKSKVSLKNGKIRKIRLKNQNKLKKNRIAYGKYLKDKEKFDINWRKMQNNVNINNKEENKSDFRWWFQNKLLKYRSNVKYLKEKAKVLLITYTHFIDFNNI